MNEYPDTNWLKASRLRPRHANPASGGYSHGHSMTANWSNSFQCTPSDCLTNQGEVEGPKVGALCLIPVVQSALVAQLRGGGAVEAEQPAGQTGTPRYIAQSDVQPPSIDSWVIPPPRVIFEPEPTGVHKASIAQDGNELALGGLNIDISSIGCAIGVSGNGPPSLRGDSNVSHSSNSARAQTRGKTGVGHAYTNAINNISFVKSRKSRTGRHAPDRSLPGQEFQPNIILLEERLLKEGADPDTVNILRTMIFHKGVTKEALKKKLTRAQLVSRRQQGVHRGAMMYNLLLRVMPGPDGKDSYCCMLCPALDRAEYKTPEDSLRHFHKDHFGMSFDCNYCDHTYWIQKELKRHLKKCGERLPKEALQVECATAG